DAGGTARPSGGADRPERGRAHHALGRLGRPGEIHRRHDQGDRRPAPDGRAVGRQLEAQPAQVGRRSPGRAIRAGDRDRREFAVDLDVDARPRTGEGRSGRQAEGESDMTYKNFTVDTDADGIALVTWNMPDRSMNVFTEEVMDEFETIIEQVAADANVKGAVFTSGKETFSCGADLGMLQKMLGVFH